MRASLVIAIVASVVAFSASVEAQASIKRTTAIPAQELAPALKTLVKEREFQIIYSSELLADRKTQGASGEFTMDEALAKLLSGTGLTYQYVDEKTVSIVPMGTQPAKEEKIEAVSGKTGAVTGMEQKERAERKSFWARFRVAQVDQGQGANEVEKPASVATSEKDDDTKLEEIVVTAQKRIERLRDVPIAISVLSGEALERSTFRGVTEALNSIPGISTTENYLGGGTNVTIRGVTASTPTLSGQSTIAYYLDEVPYGLLRTSISPDANAYDLKRLEVLRGPQGTLFGSSALNGVVRVLTNDADLKRFEAKARGSVSNSSKGSTNYRVDGAVNLPLIEDKLALRAVVGYQNDEGWIDALNKKDINDRQVETYRLKLGAQPSEALSVKLSAWRSRSESGSPSFGSRFDEIRTSMAQPIETNYDVYGAQIAYEFPAFTLTNSVGYLDYFNFAALGLDIPPVNAADSAFVEGIGSNVFSDEVSLSSTGLEKWRWSVGAMYRRGTERLHQHYTGLFETPSLVLNYYNLSKSHAVFGEITRIFDDGRWELTGGMRYFRDEESQKHQTGVGAPINPASATAHATTPRAILTWHATDNVMAYASYAQGFRSGFPPSDAVLVKNPDFPAVKPDRLHNYEVGSKGQMSGGKFSWDTAVYYIRWDDIQQQINVLFSDIAGLEYFPAQVNGDSASGPGVDLSISVQPSNSLTLSAYLGWNDLKMDALILSGGTVLFNKGDRPNGSPKYTAGSSIAYTFPLLGGGYEGTFNISGNYTSAQSYRGIGDPGVSRSDDIFTSHLTLGVDAPQKWSLMAFVDNLTNEHGTPTETFVGIPDWRAQLRPRTVGLQMEYRY